MRIAGLSKHEEMKRRRLREVAINWITLKRADNLRKWCNMINLFTFFKNLLTRVKSKIKAQTELKKVINMQFRLNFQ